MLTTPYAGTAEFDAAASLRIERIDEKVMLPTAALRRRVQARGWDRVIPLGFFEVEWEWGRIGDAFRQWAPWIFELPEPDGPPAQR